MESSSHSSSVWEEQISILDDIANNETLDKNLARIAGMVEASAPGTLCAISLLKSEGARAETYGAKIPDDILCISDAAEANPCSFATANAEVAVTDSIAADPRWKELWKQSALAQGIHSMRCWPILGPHKIVAGVLVTVRKSEKEPFPEIELTEVATRLAQVALGLTATARAGLVATENVERFRFLAESLPEKAFTASPDGKLAYINRQWATYTGVPVDEIMERGWRDFVHPDDLEEKQNSWLSSMSTGAPFECEHRFRRADGFYRWHLSRAYPMRHADGSIRMWLGSNVDVDDLKRAQFDLGESEGRLRLAMEAGGLGFWDWEIGGSIGWSQEKNPSAGIKAARGELSFDRAMSKIHPDDRNLVREALQLAQEARTDFETEFRIVENDGRMRWVAAHGRAYYAEEDGRPVRMIGVMRDITERKKAEDDLRRNQEELRAALRAAEHARDEAQAASLAKDQFLAVLSHELRTPLTPVLMAVSAISGDKTLPLHVLEALQMIQRNIKMEARLIEDLLDLTRIVRNKVELQIERIDLHQCLRQALEICRADIDSKKQALHLDLQATHHQVDGDQDRLQQVFWNLIKNAVKFTPASGDIFLRSYNRDGLVCVEVKDSGIGISKETMSFIFHPFKQGERSRQHGGLGLGLAISKASIDAHHGRLHAQSEGNDRGAIFTVELSYAHS